MNHHIPCTRRHILCALLCLTLVLVGGVLITGLMSIRDRGNRTVNMNRLKRIGLACQNYNDTMFCLPHNGGANDADELKKVNYGWHDPSIRNSGTWATQILPFLQQQAF